jgi:hypothetical protein
MYRRRLFIAAFVACVTIGGSWAVAVETATTAPTDAATLYLRAAQWITAISPAGSNIGYGSYPPFGAEWDRMAQAAWDSNGAVRRFAHQARFSDQATWPANNKKTPYLNLCRALANDLGDAAMYEHLHGNDAGAIETMEDLLHLTAMLRQNPHKGQLIRLLVAGGIDALIANRLLIIDSKVRLTTDAGDTNDLQVSVARKLIDELLDQQTPKEQFAQVGLSANGSPLMSASSSKSWMETMARENAERSFAAMSLACHIFQFENHRWPEHLDELVPNYLPHVSVDPWGNGEQILGYALIKGGLPDGSDRPLVYSRCQSQDGLFYRTDEPEYGFYNRDGSKLPAPQRKHGGQFRDVAEWAPGGIVDAISTTRPLN